MKNIALCGATICETSNYGDWLLRELIEEKIVDVIPDVNLMYFDKSHFLKGVLKAFIRADALIYIPGGYMGYIEKWYSGSKRKTFQRIWYYYLPGILFKMSRKPIALIGQGIGPYEYPLLSNMLSSICQYAKVVAVRDQKSYDLLKKIGVDKKIELTGDCAQVVCNRRMIFDTRENIDIKSRFSNKKVIFVLYFEWKIWLDRIIKALNSQINDKDYCFVIGADSVVYNRAGLIRFAKKFPKSRRYVYDYKTPKQLLSIFSVVDMIITPKLHTAITGCALGKSVVDFSVQYDKTRLYFERIGYPERVYDFFHVSDEEMSNSIKKYIDDSIVLSEEVISDSERNYLLLESFLVDYVLRTGR